MPLYPVFLSLSVPLTHARAGAQLLRLRCRRFRLCAAFRTLCCHGYWDIYICTVGLKVMSVWLPGRRTNTHTHTQCTVGVELVALNSSLNNFV